MSDRLHVAVDANVLEANWGGIPKHLHRIASELVARGDRVDLLVNLRRWESPVEGANAVPLRLRGRELWRDLAVPLWALRRRPDVLWAPETVLPRQIVDGGDRRDSDPAREHGLWRPKDVRTAAQGPQRHREVAPQLAPAQAQRNRVRPLHW